MLEFLQAYSLSEILIFLVMFAIAFKSVIAFWDWAVERLRKVFNKQTQSQQFQTSVEQYWSQNDRRIQDIVKKQKQTDDSIKQITDSVNLLIESDRDDIKAWIVEQHHYFCYEVKCIDNYSLDCLEKRYAVYKREKGNSFICDLMQEIRALPRAAINAQTGEMSIQKSNKTDKSDK